MNSSASSRPPQFSNNADEINYWKNLALDFKQKYERLLEETSGDSRKRRKRSGSPVDDRANKKMKKSSMDPFDSNILHEHVHRYIVQHFNGSDLLAVSEVSTAWNEIAEGNIGDKVQLNLESRSMSGRDFAIVENSSRAYKKVSFTSENNAGSGAITELSEYVEEMIVDIENRENREDPQSFPNLKSLELTIVADEDFWILQADMEQLEKLKLTVKYNYEIRDDDLSYVHSFLARLNNLKHLDLPASDVDVLERFLTPPPFRLDYLKATGLMMAYHPFMNSQRESLRTLVATGCCCRYEVRLFLTEFPVLQKLELTVCRCYQANDDIDNNPFPTNTTIQDLKLRTIDNIAQEDQQDNVAQFVLTSLPALISLDIGRLTGDLMEFIAENLHQLQKLSYQEAEEGALERYKEMKIAEIEGINTMVQCSKSV